MKPRAVLSGSRFSSCRKLPGSTLGPDFIEDLKVASIPESPKDPPFTSKDTPPPPLHPPHTLPRPVPFPLLNVILLIFTILCTYALTTRMRSNPACRRQVRWVLWLVRCSLCVCLHSSPVWLSVPRTACTYRAVREVKVDMFGCQDRAS